MDKLKGKRILVLKLRYIGDTLSLLPVIQNLVDKVPEIQVDVMVNKGTEEVLVDQPGLRKVWVYDRAKAKKSIISSFIYHKDLISRLRSGNYDVVFDFTHGDRAAFLSFMTGAPMRLTSRNASTLSRLLMNHVIREDPQKYHIVDYQLLSLKSFGLDDFKRSSKLYVPESVQERVDGMLESSGVNPGDLKIVIHPGARGRLRQWGPERFAEIARRCVETYQAAILLIGGPGDEPLVNRVERHVGFPLAIKQTRFTLLELGALLKRSQLFFGNDSAPGHIAASVGCPTLTLFGPTFPHMWRPVHDSGDVIFKGVSCCGCRQETCIRPENSCMDMIGVEEVWEKIIEMLKSYS